MDDADRVARREAIEDRVRDPKHFADRHDAACALPGVANGLPLQKLHDEERLTVVRHVVVEDSHARGVTNFVRDVSLAKEPLADDSIARKIRVQDLQRGGLSIPMRCRKHGRHPADAEQRVEVPLASDRRPDARPGAFVGLARERIGRRGVQRFGHVRLSLFSRLVSQPSAVRADQPSRVEGGSARLSG